MYDTKCIRITDTLNPLYKLQALKKFYNLKKKIDLVTVSRNISISSNSIKLWMYIEGEVARK